MKITEIIIDSKEIPDDDAFSLFGSSKLKEFFFKYYSTLLIEQNIENSFSKFDLFVLLVLKDSGPLKSEVRIQTNPTNPF